MDMKRHLKSALKQIGFDKPRKAQIIPMNTLDAEQDAIIIAATGSGKQVIYETVGLAHSDKLTVVIEPLLALIYNQVQTLQAQGIPADYCRGGPDSGCAVVHTRPEYEAAEGD